jgi:hypothetical protein
MKFSKQLMYNAVAEWREHYLDYSELKKYISRLGSVRQQLRKYNAGDPALSHSPLREATLAFWIRGDVPRGRSVSHSTASLSSPPPEELEVDALHAKAAARFAPLLPSQSHGNSNETSTSTGTTPPDVSAEFGARAVSWTREGDERSLPPRFSPPLRASTSTASAGHGETQGNEKHLLREPHSSMAMEEQTTGEMISVTSGAPTASTENRFATTTIPIEAMMSQRYRQTELPRSSQQQQQQVNRDDEDDDDDDSDGDDDDSDTEHHAEPGDVALNVGATTQSASTSKATNEQGAAASAQTSSATASGTRTRTSHQVSGLQVSPGESVPWQRVASPTLLTNQPESSAIGGKEWHMDSRTSEMTNTGRADAHRSGRNTRLAPALRKTASANVLFELEHGTPRHAPSDYIAPISAVPVAKTKASEHAQCAQDIAHASPVVSEVMSSAQRSEEPVRPGHNQTNVIPSTMVNEHTPLIADASGSRPLDECSYLASSIGRPRYGASDRIPHPVRANASNLTRTAASVVPSTPRPSLSPVALPWAGTAPLAPFVPNEEWVQSHREAFWRIERRFFERLHIEAVKVDAFFCAMQRELERISRALLIDADASTTRRDRPRLALLRQRYREHYVEIVELVNFVDLNATGFDKILKKHDKVTGLQTKASFQRQILQAFAFYRTAHELRQADTGTIREQAQVPIVP